MVAPRKNTKPAFRSNENLKPENQIENITKEEYDRRTAEIIRCKNDIVYFAEKYFTIVEPKLGRHLIQCYPKQKELLRFFTDTDRAILVSPRQQGKTITMCIFALHKTMFTNDKKIFYAANRFKTAKNFIKKIKFAYELMPNWLKPGIKIWNEASIEFSNGSGIEGDSTTSDSGRSATAECLILDECLDGTTEITLRNKITGEIIKTPIRKLFFKKYK